MADAELSRPAAPSVRVAVVMERETAPNRWEDWRFRIAEVVPHEDAFGLEPRVLRDDGKLQRTLHPGLHARAVPRRGARATT